MTELRIPYPDMEQLAEYDTADLHQLIGEVERARYKLSELESGIMYRLDEREDA